MIIECINCKAKYDVPDEKLKSRLKMKCSKCGTVFSIDDVNSVSDDKDTAKIIKNQQDDSLWSSENLELPQDKKYSIAVTCIVFVLIGVPLGIMTRKSSGTIGVAMGMFFI